MKKYVIDGHTLSLEDVYNISHSTNIHVSLGETAKKKIKTASDFVADLIKDPDRVVYGVNTGFGALSNKKIPNEQLADLQLNLIRSHCTGVGEIFGQETTRAILLLRANCLIQGHSGVQEETVQLILDFLNHNINPVIPRQGSVGASGDLAPLAHMALALIGEGEVVYQGKKVSSSYAIHEIGKKPVVLGPKEGLALINGTTVMSAMGAVAVIKAKKLATLCDVASAMTLDALEGSIKPFDIDISKLKPHPGQLAVSENLNNLLEGSEILNSHENCGKVQDPYSLRCIPQVHGACRQTIRHVDDVLAIEINSVTDNPLIFTEENKVISGGNFHGEAIALAMDYLSMGVSELNNILERRIEKMMNPLFSSLPAFLIEDSGLNSGLMITHVTVAALASENKTLCFPASVDSIPTSTDKEDHVSMGITSGRKLLRILENLENSLAIEFLCNTQALEFRKAKTSPALQSVHSLIRKHVEPISKDRVFAKDIENIKSLIANDEILNLVTDQIQLH